MYCDKCDIDVSYKTNICPICNNKLSDIDIIENNTYPRRNAGFRYPKHYSFTSVYTIVATIISLAMLIVNLIIGREILWAFIVAAGFIYFYILIRHTIVSSYGSAGKIFVQGTILSILLLIIQNITDSGSWAYEYVVPMILFINTLTLWIVSFIRKIRRSNYIFALLGISLLDLIPSIWLIMGLNNILWTSILTLVVGIISLLIIFSIFSKNLFAEIKRLLHI